MDFIYDGGNPVDTLVVECSAACYVLHGVWLGDPDLAYSPQGYHCGGSDTPVVDDPGTSSGWQQSKLNWTLSAVVG